MFGKLGSLWVCLGHLGPLRAFAGLFLETAELPVPGAPEGWSQHAISSVSSNPLEFRATSRNFEHQPEFRANGLYFEQSQSWLNKDQPMDFRATRLSFEQPAPQFRAFRAHDRRGPDWPVWQQFQVPGSVSRFLGGFGQFWGSGAFGDPRNPQRQKTPKDNPA